MAHFLEHCRDCKALLGYQYEQVHAWMDAGFARLGPRHRFERHHIEGVRKVEALFGWEAAKAAIIHIVRDCGHVPAAADYPPLDHHGVSDNGYAVDVLGIALENNEYKPLPEMLAYDSLTETARQRFRCQVEKEWARLLKGL